jgi:enhancing lycopene biosynthesis protein 2
MSISTIITQNALDIYAKNFTATDITATGNLLVSGSQHISGSTTFTSTTNSTSSSTGALVISGGMGIYKDVNINGDLTVQGDITCETINYEEQEIIESTNDSTSITTGASVVMGGMGIVKRANIGGVCEIWNTTQSTSSSTGALQCLGGCGITKDLYVGGNIYGNLGGIITINNTTDSTSVSTGALIVKGGLGVAKSLFTDSLDVNECYINGSIPSTSTTTGSLVVSGGMGLSGNIYAFGNINSQGQIQGITENITGTNSNAIYCVGGIEGDLLKSDSTVDSTSISTGSIICSGGLGVAKNTFVGGTMNIQGITEITNTTDSTSTSTGAFIVDGGLGVAKNANLNSTTVSSIQVNGTTGITGITTITNTTNSNSTSNGAIVVNGGMGLKNDIFCGGCLYLNNTNGTTLQLYSTLDSTSPTIGSVIIPGGVGINKNLNVGGQLGITNTTQSTSTSTGSVLLSGGLGVAKDIYAAAIHISSGAYSLYNYGNNQLIPTSTASTGNIIYSTAFGGGWNLLYGESTFNNSAESISISKTTESTSYTTGSLILSGGLGVAKNIYCDGEFVLNTISLKPYCNIITGNWGGCFASASGAVIVSVIAKTITLTLIGPSSSSGFGSSCSGFDKTATGNDYVTFDTPLPVTARPSTPDYFYHLWWDFADNIPLICFVDKSGNLKIGKGDGATYVPPIIFSISDKIQIYPNQTMTFTAY